MRRIPALIAALVMVCAARAEYWFETFEQSPPGTPLIGSFPGWTGIGLSAVATSRPYAGVRSLRLPPVGGMITKSSAVYSNLNYQYVAGSGYIVRASAQLYRSGTNQDVSLYLGLDGTNIVSLRTATNGTLLLNTNVTTTAFVTGRYVQVALFYHLAQNRAGLEYDGQVVVAWSNVVTTPSTRFNMFWAERTALGGSDSGEVYLDNVSVETIPASTWGWWRFEETNNNSAAEQTHRFAAAGDSVCPPVQPLLDRMDQGEEVVQNRGAIVYPTRHAHLLLTNGTSLGRWTLEFIYRIHPGFYTGARSGLFFIQAETPLSRPSIEVRMEDDEVLNILLEDDEGGSGTARYTPGYSLPKDGRWHHLAIVVTDGIMETYLDYDLASYSILTEASSGSYTFPTNSIVNLGFEIGSSETNLCVDEIRLSSAQLTPEKFLRTGPPRITGAVRGAGTTNLVLSAVVTPRLIYHVEGCTNLGEAAVWQDYGRWGSSQFEGLLPVLSNSPAAAIRLREP